MPKCPESHRWMPNITRVRECHFQHRNIIDHGCSDCRYEEKNGSGEDEESPYMVDGGGSRHLEGWLWRGRVWVGSGALYQLILIWVWTEYSRANRNDAGLRRARLCPILKVENRRCAWSPGHTTSSLFLDGNWAWLVPAWGCRAELSCLWEVAVPSSGYA